MTLDQLLLLSNNVLMIIECVLLVQLLRKKN